MSDKNFTIAEARLLLQEKFAPWVQDLDLRFESLEDGEVLMRVPASDRLNREGGTICGQAIMAAADTAMVFAVASLMDGFVPMTTVSQSSSFLRAATEADMMVHASIIKPGRTIVYGEVYLYTLGPDKPIAHVTNTTMLL
ncbi:MAG: thioesterase [Gammaproteobacteria bacterium]|nr:thioesterase [Gammaproteobacteria bacterium]